MDEKLELLEKELNDLKKSRQPKTRSKKKDFSKKIVIAVIIMNIAFTIAIMYLFLKTSSEPQTLIASWFGFTTVEMWNMAKIKQSKIKQTKENE